MILQILPSFHFLKNILLRAKLRKQKEELQLLGCIMLLMVKHGYCKSTKKAQDILQTKLDE